MKNLLFILFLVIPASLFCSNDGFWPLEEYDFKSNVNTKSVGVFYNNIESTIEELIKADQWEMAYHPYGFYPIGWSVDGKFAYTVIDDGGESGMSPILFFIIDTVTDEFIYNETVDGVKVKEIISGYPGVNKPEDILESNQTAWNEISSTYIKMLKSNKIYGDKLVKYSTLNIIPYGSERDDGEFHSPYLSNYSIKVVKPEEGTKTIYSGSCESSEFIPTIGISVFGAFQSPYENRIVVLFGLWDTGWEGKPWMDLKLSGSNQSYGFK